MLHHAMLSLCLSTRMHKIPIMRKLVQQEVMNTTRPTQTKPPPRALGRNEADSFREEARPVEKDDPDSSQRGEIDVTVELMKKAFQAGATRIVFIYGPQPEPSNKTPIEAVIYVDNFAEYNNVDAAE